MGARVGSSGVPLAPLKHAFDLLKKDKERQRYKNPILLLSMFHEGQGERGKERILLPLLQFQQSPTNGIQNKEFERQGILGDVGFDT